MRYSLISILSEQRSKSGSVPSPAPTACSPLATIRIFLINLKLVLFMTPIVDYGKATLNATVSSELNTYTFFPANMSRFAKVLLYVLAKQDQFNLSYISRVHVWFELEFELQL